jgi:chaperonin GroEL (HSP60 family)
MVKVELLKREKTSVLFFESRTTDDTAIKELDELYAILMTSLGPSNAKGVYENSSRFSIELKNVG